MSRAAAIGDARRLAGFALAGVLVAEATDAASAHAAWESLPEDTALLILSPDARDHLRSRLAERADLVWTVLPE
jgi:vacuolar-type H+-ATPase subunit F/Vma7